MERLFEAGLRRIGRRPDLFSGLLLAGIISAGVGLLAFATWNASYVEDSWHFLKVAQDDSLASLLEPWNGHLLGFGLLVQRLSVDVFGNSFTPFVILNLLGIATCSVLVYIYARRRIGRWIALVPALIPVFYAASSYFYGTGMQMNPMIGITAVYSLNFGIAALLFIENRTQKGDALACLMLGLCLATFSYGLFFLVGVGLAIFFADRRWHRSWVVLVPAALYLAWRIWATHRFGSIESGISVVNVLWSPLYLFDSLGIVIAGMFGLSDELGRGPTTSIFNGSYHSSVNLRQGLLMLVGLIVLVGALAVTRGRKGLLRIAVLPPAAVLAGLWLSQALVMNPANRMPGDPRYLLAGAVLLGIVFSELYRDFKFSRRATALLVAIACLGVLANLEGFDVARNAGVREANRVGVAGAMIELAGENAKPDFNPAKRFPQYALTMNVKASDYQDIEANGSGIAMPLDEVRRQDEATRIGADQILAGVEGVSTKPLVKRGIALPHPKCVRLRPQEETAVGPGVIVLRDSRGTAPALRRFADEPTVRLQPSATAGDVVFRIPPDRDPDPWLLSDTSGESVTVCRPSR